MNNKNMKNIFKNKESEHWKEVKFTLPKVKNGSIIEYTYTIQSPYFFNFTGWYFQSDIPKIYSELHSLIPGNWKYNKRLIGYKKLDINIQKLKVGCFTFTGLERAANCEDLTYAMKDIPAFKEESLLTTKENYLSHIAFELAEHQSFRGVKTKYSTTWDKVDKKFRNDYAIGRQLNRVDYTKKLLPTELFTENDTLKRAIKVYHYIQNYFKWNGEYHVTKSVDFKKAFKLKKGVCLYSIKKHKRNFSPPQSYFSINIELINILRNELLAPPNELKRLLDKYLVVEKEVDLKKDVLPKISLTGINREKFILYFACLKAEENRKSSNFIRKKFTGSNLLLYLAYVEILNYIKREISKNKNPLIELSRIKKALLESIKFVEITAIKNREIYLIFETLNDRGMLLKTFEMIKNHIFGRGNLKDKVTLEILWKNIIKDFSPDDKLNKYLLPIYRSRYSEEYRLKEEDIQFIDTAGNAYIKADPLHIYVKGNKQKHENIKKKEEKTRAFTQTGLKVIYAFLCNPELVNAPYRDIAEIADVALGTVGWVITDLKAIGFIIDRGGKRGRRIVNYKKLLDRWVETYPEKLKVKQFMGNFEAPEPYWWKKFDITRYGAYWGGEIAAAKYTKYLKPEEVTIYLPEVTKGGLFTDARLHKDPNGKVKIYQAFWEMPQNYDGLVHPVLAYADLIATGDARNIETARMIKDEHIKPVWKD